MSNDDKPQPKGWVAVDFHDPKRTFWGMNGWTDHSGVLPFSSENGAHNGGSGRVFTWPLPSAVIAMLHHYHPTVDWSQVPVAVEAEKPGRWVIQDLTGGRDPYHDRDGWREAAECANPWPTKAGAEASMRKMDWSLDRFALVNLDDMPAPAVAEPSEVEKLRAEVERLTRERDELREELSRCKQAHSAAEDDVESLREQLGKAILSRRDEFAKAALTGMLSDPSTTDLRCEDFARRSVLVADATIRALDGAGGA